MPLASGTKLGPYEILAPLGAGGMGEVYRARDTRLDRQVAIKVLAARLSTHPDLRQRFEREARAISNLNHPHICILHDIGRQDQTDYLVLEYLEGETLEARLRHGALPADVLLRYGLEIADALEKAHRLGIVHRDLKPANIMVTKAGTKLLDFGLAKLKAAVAPLASALTEMATEAAKLTDEGALVGTFQYMAPEQLEAKDADARTDIFAFGSTLYEMATGRAAFTGRTKASLIAAILSSEPPPVSQLQPLAPPALERLVRTCLAKDPDERWQTAHDLKLQLQWIAEGGSQAGVPAAVTARRRSKERVWISISALLLLLALASAGAYLRLAVAPARAIRAYILPPEKATFEFTNLDAGPVALSPDGSRAVFAARSPEGKVLLWIRPLDSPSAQPLTATEGAYYPFWSPDSRFIGFFADGKLKVIDASGGPPVVLCDAVRGRGGSWSREGNIVFTPDVYASLYRVPAAGGAIAQVTKLSASRQENSHRWPDFLPDGRHFLYYARSSSVEYSGTYAGSLDGGEPKLVLRGDSNATYAAPGYLLFVRDGTLMAQRFDARRIELRGDPSPVADRVTVDVSATQRGVFAASESGLLAYMGGPASQPGWQQAWLDRAGKQGGALGTSGLYFTPRFSPDGRKLAVSVFDSRVSTSRNIWVYDLLRGVATRLTFASFIERSPVWSPDGSRIAYASNRKGLYHIYQKPADGTGAEQTLLETTADELPWSWSSDGRYLSCIRREIQGKRNWGVWVLPMFGDRKPFPVLQNEFDEADPEFSPDGKWLAYSSNESGRFEVYIVPFPQQGGKWQVSTKGGSQPRWRRDGKELFYLGTDYRMMAAEIKQTGRTLQIGSVQPLFQTRAVSVTPGWAFDVSGDGKKFLVETGTESGTTEPITLVVNWPALLKK